MKAKPLIIRSIFGLLTILVLAACQTAASGPVSTVESADTPAEVSQPAELTVMTHDSFQVSESVVQAFEQENGVTVTFIKSGDVGSALNRAILTKNAPTADVFYGLDNTFLSRALEEDIFEAYDSPMLSKISTDYQLDAENRVIPIDYGDVCINYDKAYFSDKGLAVPQTLEELTNPEYKGLLVVENPATSSPGLAFLMATIAHFGEDGYLDYWNQLVDNGVVVVDGWETAYYTNFSGSSGQGPQPMAVSYGTSPAVEVYYATTPLDEAPTASIVGPDTCFRQIEFAGILKGTQNRSLAEKFIDFMLSKTFQEDMPLQMYVFPVNPEAVLPDIFQENIQIPEQPAVLDPALISSQRETWISDWTDTVLR